MFIIVMEFFFIILFFGVFSVTVCFNFDTQHAIVYENPDPFDSQSYFGFSIILYPKDEFSQPWIQIAAPKGMDPSADNINSGTIYRCGIADKCYNLYVHNFVNQRTTLHDYGWLGNAMDIDYTFKKYVICAYRWLNVANDEYSTYKVRGKCFWSSINDDHFYGLNPLEYSSISFSSVGQAGFSAHMSKCKSEPEIVLGVPGIDNWQGSTIIYRHSRGSNATTRQPSFGPVIYNEFGDLNIIPPTNNLFFSFDLLGYVVSSGYFFGTDELIYVAGAPRSSRYFGKVFIFKFNHQHSMLPVRLLSAEEPQFGEYYGASVAVGDFNNDGYDDLIVGAPFYANKGYNKGRVLLYLGSKDGKFVLPIQSAIYGKIPGGQFGLAMSAFGDIDLDGFCDVGIAAPFADDTRGIVYIYRGSRSGLNSEPSQIIKAREIDDNLLAFGSSFSKAADIDGNHYDDIAVGAYKSGHAVLLRSKPIIALKQIVTSYTKKLAYGDTNFTIEHCIWYAGSFLPNTTNIVRNFTLDPIYQRAFLTNDNPKNIELREENIFCDKTTIFLKNTTVFLPVIIITNISLIEHIKARNIVHVNQHNANSDTFCLTCPVFNKHASEVHNRLEIPFSIGCGDDNLCRANLELNYKLEDILNDTFIIGANSNLLNLIIKIKNTGEKALKTELYVELPYIVYFANEKGQSHNETFDIANPLNENEERELVISLDMSEVNLGNQHLNSITFLMNVTSLSMIVDLEKTKKVAVLFIRRDADIYLKGISEEQSYSFGNFSFESVNITQIYTVQKYGPSPIHASRLFIEVPTKLVLPKTNETIDILSLLISDASLRDEIGLHCETNITKVKESLKTDHLNIEYYIPPAETRELDETTDAPRKLLKRHVDNPQTKNNLIFEHDNADGFDETKFSNNRTLFLNCNNTSVICEEIVCHVGNLIDQQDTALYRLKMMLNIGKIKEILEKEHKDVVLLSTRGNVYVDDPFDFKQTGDRPDEATITTVILGPQPKYSVPLWIIIISVIGGLLLLMFLILFLVKVGFFRRKKREELQELKKNVVSTIKKRERKD